MNWIIIALLLFVFFLVLAKAKKQRDAFPYQAAHALFSPAERSFLGVLDQAVGGRCRVFGKVRIADVATVKPMRDYPAWQRAFNRISAKHFDFILCDHRDLSILCAIELDDQSHQARKRQQRDAFVETVCETIGLPLIRIPARQAYSVTEIRQILSAALEVSFESGESIPAKQRPPSPSLIEENPVCPQCTSPMVRRTSRTGKNAGKSFWGCSQYPRCRGIISTDG
jgi:hypothetical protein